MSNTRDSTTFPFFDLPPELREMIFHELRIQNIYDSFEGTWTSTSCPRQNGYTCMMRIQTGCRHGCLNCARNPPCSLSCPRDTAWFINLTWRDHGPSTKGRAEDWAQRLRRAGSNKFGEVDHAYERLMREADEFFARKLQVDSWCGSKVPVS